MTDNWEMYVCSEVYISFTIFCRFETSEVSVGGERMQGTYADERY